MSAPAPQFKQQAAENVASCLQDAIKNLRQQRSDRHERARKLREDWKGGYADQFFTSEEPAIERRAEAMITRLQHLLKQLAKASERAQEDETNWEASNLPGAVASAP